MLNICKRDYSVNLEMRYDESFRSLKMSGLTWLPWVGKNYNKGKGLLVVGESNYADLEMPGDTIDIAKQRLKDDENFTRKVVDCFGCCRRQKNRTFTALLKILSGEYRKTISDDDSLKVWRTIAYMDIVQNPMWGLKTCCDAVEDPRSRERPTNKEFVEGWTVVKKVIAKIKPACVLFVGVGIIDRLGGELKFDIVKRAGISFRQGTLDNNIPFVAIMHPAARGFSSLKAARFLKEIRFLP